MVFPTIGPSVTPKGRPKADAFVALPPKSNVMGVILSPSQIVWLRVELTDVTSIKATGTIVMSPISVCGAQVPDVVTV